MSNNVVLETIRRLKAQATRLENSIAKAEKTLADDKPALASLNDAIEGMKKQFNLSEQDLAGPANRAQGSKSNIGAPISVAKKAVASPPEDKK